MKLVSLELTAADAKEDAGGCLEPSELPKFPYGTSLYLDEDEQKKLGIKEMPDVGTEFPLEAVVRVTGTSQRETQSGTRKTLDLQIVKMGIGIEEEPETVMGKAASKLYGGTSE